MLNINDIFSQVIAGLAIILIIAISKLFFEVQRLKIFRDGARNSFKEIKKEIDELEITYQSEIGKTEERLEKAIRILDEKIESNKSDMKDGFKDLKKDIRDLQNLIQQTYFIRPKE